MPRTISGDYKFQFGQLAPTREGEEFWKNRYEELANRCQEAMQTPATVVGLAGKKVLVRNGSNFFVVTPPAGMELMPGDAVMLMIQGGIIAGKDPNPPRIGNVLRVRAVDGASVELETPQGSHYAALGRTPVKPGDRVLLDMTNSVVVHVLPAEQPPAPPAHEAIEVVEWNDVVGQAEAKLALREAIEGPIKDKALYEAYGRKPTKGVLLYGPPGTGKTMLGKASATALARLHGAESAATGFVYVKGPELLNKWVGSTESGIRDLFERARRHKRLRGYPAIIFLDEADALLCRRDGGGLHDGMERTLVPAFLAEMDGMGTTGAIVMLATNRPDVLDPAAVREGRVDRRVKVGRPTREDVAEIAHKLLSRKPLVGLASDYAQVLADEVFGGRYPLKILRSRTGKDDARVGIEAFVSGAMVAGIVERAVQRAIRRDSEIREGDEVVVGITHYDVREAVAEAARELRGVDHESVLREVIAERRFDVVRVEDVA